MRIVELAAEHEQALRAFLDDFARVGEDEVPAWFADPAWTHAETVETLAAWARGERLPARWVPSTTWFLEHEGELLGLVNLRHELTDGLRRLGGHVGYAVRPSARGRGHATRMLEAVKGRARALGLERLLVTCDDDNLASARVIERCGGGLLDVIDRGGGRRTRRYEIALGWPGPITRGRGPNVEP